MVGLWILFIFPTEETKKEREYIGRIYLVGYSWFFGLIFGHVSFCELFLLICSSVSNCSMKYSITMSHYTVCGSGNQEKMCMNKISGKRRRKIIE